jgi:hypothetical protein
MSVTYGFYNSVNGDRRYNTPQMSSIFDGIIRDGVFQSIGTAFAVTPGTGLHVSVGVGRAWFDHTWTLNDGALVLAIDTPDLFHPRYDAIILEVNSSNGVRANSIKVLKGQAADNPVAPSLTNNTTLHQYYLAYVYVAVGVTSFIQGNITNKVGTISTPFVTGPLAVITTDDLLTQWASQFNVWFNNLQIVLAGNVAANLQNEINNANRTLIQEIFSTGTEDEFNFTNIPAGYHQLLLTGTLKCVNTGEYGAANVMVKINNDSNADYGYLDKDTGEWQLNIYNMTIPWVVGSKQADVNLVNTVKLEFPAYDSIDVYKWINLSGISANLFGNPTLGGAYSIANLWKVASPISRIQVFGTFVENISCLRLFGCAS